MSSNNLSLLQQAHTFLERPHNLQQVQHGEIEPATTLQVFSTTDASVALHDHLLLQEQQQAGAPAETDEQVSSRTIVATDDDVSNGFVKDGRRLPYVFEATETGSKKRASKILPVCGVCGKRFVCVTTMKRHLVTHTGEKPFACKICGKQYTQKGNLRVHERTHRNDRPFECNICHQKFYRKEPMQKHQWRQHGIVHFKGQPPPHCAPSATNTTGPQPPPTITTGPQQPEPISVVTYRPKPPETKMLYSSMVDHLKSRSLDSFQESSRHLDSRPVEEAPIFTYSSEPERISKPSKVCSIVTAALDMSVDALSSSKEPPVVPKAADELSSLSSNTSPSLSTSSGEFEYAKPASSSSTSCSSSTTDEFKLTLPNHYVNNNKSAAEKAETTSPPSSTTSPLKLKKVLADAYQKEVEQHQQHDNVTDSNDATKDSSQPLDLSQTRPKYNDNDITTDKSSQSPSQSLPQTTTLTVRQDRPNDMTMTVRRPYNDSSDSEQLLPDQTKRPRPDTYEPDQTISTTDSRHKSLPPIAGLTRPVSTLMTKGLVPPWITITKMTKNSNNSNNNMTDINNDHKNEVTLTKLQPDFARPKMTLTRHEYLNMPTDKLRPPTDGRNV